MLIYLYRLLINIVFILSPIIIVLRLIKKKEHFKRFKEKFCFFSHKKKQKKLIWFHGASVGELLSVIPLIKELEKDKKINQILVTTTTLSSSKVFNNFKFKKTIHQFFPIDTNFHSKKFLNYWKPSLAIFIDSEIWPNMLLNIKKKSIPALLLNARITKKSFNRWKFFKSFSSELFKCFTKSYPCNNETWRYLNYFGIKKKRFLGNLKFSQNNLKNLIIPAKLKKFISNKNFWCATSTHEPEEVLCSEVHKNLKKKYTKFLTIIIPRHVHRCESLINFFENSGLKVHCHSWSQNINHNTDIYLVDTYGDTNLFFSFNKIVFVGGSIIKHGGQNPLEPARYGNKIIHGPNVANFKEIYELLKKLGISKKVNSIKSLTKTVSKLIKQKPNSSLLTKKIEQIGSQILDATLIEIKLILKNNEIK